MTDLALNIIDLRQRCAAGEAVSDDEIRAALQAIRISRVAATQATGKKKAAATPMADEALQALFGAVPK